MKEAPTTSKKSCNDKTSVTGARPVKGPRLWGILIANTDFSFHKNFKIGERVNLQFRMEFFNVFNTTQFQANSDGVTGIHVDLINNAVACNAGNVGNSGSVCYGHAINTVGWSFGTNSRDGTAYGNQAFGQAQRDKGPREIQYSLKVEF